MIHHCVCASCSCDAADSTGTTVDAGLQPDSISAGAVRRRLQALARGIRAFVTGGRKLRADLLLGGDVVAPDPFALGAPELEAQAEQTVVGAELPVPAVDPRE